MAIRIKKTYNRSNFDIRNRFLFDFRNVFNDVINHPTYYNHKKRIRIYKPTYNNN